MAIISKPELIYKGIPAVLTLFKTNLISHHIVSANSRFSDFSNWKEVYINYKSSEGNQVVIVNFDSDDGFQNGIFSASERARDSFIVDSITIVDLDGEILKINRSELNVSDFDFTFELGLNVNPDTDSDSDEFVLLLENGSSLLLESGEYLLLE